MVRYRSRFGLILVTAATVAAIACGGSGDSKPSPTATYEKPTVAASATPYPTNTQEPTATPVPATYTAVPPTNTPLPPGCDAFPELPSLSEASAYRVLLSRTGGNFYAVPNFDGLGSYRFNISYTDEQLTDVINKINRINELEGQYRIPTDARFVIEYYDGSTHMEINETKLASLPRRVDVSPFESLPVVLCGI